MSARIDLPELRPLEQITGLERVQKSFLATLRPKPEGQTYAWREYVNRETGRRYDYHHFDPTKPQRIPCDGTDKGCQNPHHMQEKMFVYSDGPKYALAKGGEGGGKSVAGIIKDLERLRRGMSGWMGSPDFEHFRRSLWAEFRRWCPLEAVIERERYRLRTDWEPSKGFELHFRNEYGGITTLQCGGADDPMSLEGPNISWAHGDEVRRKREAQMLTVLAGRVRIDGPKGEKPQLWFTTTPAMNWLYDYFGGVPDYDGKLDPGQEHFKKEDPLAVFKQRSVVISLYTEDNQAFLTDGYVEDRGAAFQTESERNVHLRAAWEDIGDISHFLNDITLWDHCEDPDLPGELGPHEPVVLALDGAYSAKGDTFGAVAAGPHPADEDRMALRAAMAWEAKGIARDFDDIEDELKEFILDHAVQEVAYDPRELHQMAGGLRKRGVTRSGRDYPGIMCTEFPQGTLREQSDKNLETIIVSRKLAHAGSRMPNGPLLRKHVNNADRQTTVDGKRLRIVRRQKNLKIDLTVCASMAAFKAENIRPAVPLPSSHSFGVFKSRRS
jgi:hypothetical protein